MFRLGPRASQVNTLYYRTENNSHTSSAPSVTDELATYNEPTGSSREVPEEIREIEFDDVHFSYDDEEDVLAGSTSPSRTANSSDSSGSRARANRRSSRFLRVCTGRSR